MSRQLFSLSLADSTLTYFVIFRESEFEKLPATTVPEMQRSELSMAILQLKALGVHNVLRFDFPSPPPARHLVAALELLYALGAIQDGGELTQPLGTTMAEFPVHPLMSKTLLISGMKLNFSFKMVVSSREAKNSNTLRTDFLR